jgi:hypothetical protein
MMKSHPQFVQAQIHAHRERYARRRMAALAWGSATRHEYLKLAHEARVHAAAIERLAMEVRS